MRNVIVSFIGENENGILRHLSHGLMALMRPHGYEPHVIELSEPSWPGQLEQLVRRGVAMAWGHAGVGASLAMNGQSFWDTVQIPFVSVLADPPCWRPCNHAIASRYVVNAYLYPEWLRVQQRFIRSPQVSALVQGGLFPNPMRDDVPWRDRPRRMVLVKTGDDPAARRQGWATLPPRMRTVLEDAAAASLQLGTADITETLLDACAAHSIAYDGRTDILFGLMTELDLYVRATRSTALATALLDLPVDIYGRGWNHLSSATRRANFHPAFDAAELPSLYAQTQFMLNTTPNFSSGVHERVAYAMEARCCVISDLNDYMRTSLAGMPTVFGIDPLASDASDRLAEMYHGPSDYTDLTQPALDFAAREFDGVRYMRSLLDLADEVRIAERFTEYRH